MVHQRLILSSCMLLWELTEEIVKTVPRFRDQPPSFLSAFPGSCSVKEIICYLRAFCQCSFPGEGSSTYIQPELC